MLSYKHFFYVPSTVLSILQDINLFKLHINLIQGGTTVNIILLQKMTPRHREVKELSQGHTATVTIESPVVWFCTPYSQPVHMLLLEIRWFRGGARSSEEVNIFPYILIQCRKHRLLHQHQNNFTFHLNATPSFKATPRPQEKQEAKCRQRKRPLLVVCPHHTTTTHPRQRHSPWTVPSGHRTGHLRGHRNSGPFLAGHTSLQ